MVPVNSGSLVPIRVMVGKALVKDLAHWSKEHEYGVSRRDKRTVVSPRREICGGATQLDHVEGSKTQMLSHERRASLLC